MTATRWPGLPGTFPYHFEVKLSCGHMEVADFSDGRFTGSLRCATCEDAAQLNIPPEPAASP